MTGAVFVDTNILIYAHDRDANEKRRVAASALEELWSNKTGRVSVQVLQEFYVTVTKKLATPLARAAAREIIRTYTPWVQASTTPETVIRAAELSELAQLSFWDGLIVAAAEQVSATAILSEDMNTGQVIAGIRIVNPFA
jgi:predicted nucleic acid-binding protein